MRNDTAILLIQSTPAEAVRLRQLLAESKRHRFSVQHARDVAEGLSLLKGGSFDCILIDLPFKGHGLDAALELRKVASQTPIVAIVVPEDEEMALKSLKMDVQDYLIEGDINGTILERSISCAIERERVARELREREELFASFMRHLPAAAWMKDMQGRYVFVNAEAERIFSAPAAALRGKTDLDLFPQETALQFGENDCRVLSQGGSLRTTEILRQKDGTEHCSIVSKFAVNGPDGEPAYVAGIAVDITERKRAEEALRRSAARYRALYRDNPSMIATIDADLTILSVNPFCANQLGYSKEELVGRSVLSIFHEEDRSPVAEQLRQCLQRPYQVHRWQFRKVRKDGGLLWVEELAQAVRDLDGALNVLIVCQDITERIRAEETLRKSERKFSRIFHAVPALIGISSLKEGRVVDVNEAALETLGYRREEVIGHTVSELGLWASEYDRATVVETLKKEGSVRNKEVRFKDKNGQTCVGLYSAELVELEGERYLLSLVRDITARKRAEEEIERLNTDLAARAFELELANQELEAFNYTVAHDLRTPLNVISGYCQAIEMICGNQLQGECGEFLHQAYEGTVRMNRLIGALLNFSRLARVELHHETVDLSTLAQETAAELKATQPERRVAFRIADGVTADGDANLLRVALDNLLGNAWKYTGARQEAVIEFGVTDVDGLPAFFVRDNGTGFDVADAKELFVPFRRLPGAERVRGFGIGLATVERIVRRHGGRIWAEGEPGKGAIFYFTLP